MCRAGRGWRVARALAVSVVPMAWAASAGAQRLDLSRPEDVVKANRRIQCSLEDGRPALFTWRGGAYSRVPGERDRHLFDVEGMNVRQCVTVTDPQRGYGYRLLSRELMLYLDPETGAVLRTWTNPWTGKVVEVVHVANDPVNQPPSFAFTERGEPAVFRGTVMKGRVWQSFEVPLFYRNPLGGDYQEYVGGTYHAMEMFTFFMDEADLLDTTRDMRTVTVHWSRVSGWLPWMEMGDRPGLMFFTTVGRRLDDPAHLSARLKAEIQARYPEYTSPPPPTDTRPNETTWTYFKKYIDARRQAQPPKR
jgi:hypothetical protein